MGKKKFDLGAVNQAMIGSSSSAVSQTLSKIENTSRQQEIEEPRFFKRISYKKIKPSPLNDYPIIDIDEMESLLLSYGLLTNLSVHYNEESDIYEIESGERRYTALVNLFSKYENTEEKSLEYDLYMQNLHSLYINGIPCNVESSDQDDDSIRARIIIHNETDRPFDPIRTAGKISELAEIYTRKNRQLPKTERFNVNQKIAADFNNKYSERQIIRYKNFDKLVPELKNAIVVTGQPMSEASTLHTLSNEEQIILADALKSSYESGNTMNLPSVEEVHSIIESYDTSESTIDSNMLEQVKKEAAQKILEAQDKRENKIKGTVQTLKKKSDQLINAIESYKKETGKSPDFSDLEDDIKIIISNLSKL